MPCQSNRSEIINEISHLIVIVIDGNEKASAGEKYKIFRNHWIRTPNSNDICQVTVWCLLSFEFTVKLATRER